MAHPRRQCSDSAPAGPSRTDGQSVRADVHSPPMRSFLAGSFFCLLLLGLPPAVEAQINQQRSFVQSIGFEKSYRPDAWVRMVFNLQSTLGEPAEYQIQVLQTDMDGDHVVYSRQITLNAMQQERYWVYFRPRPSGLDVSST